MITQKLWIMPGVFFVSLFAVLFISSAPGTAGSSGGRSTLPRSMAEPTPESNKSFAEYKGVAIGMTADAARQKLGVPKDKSAEQDLYTFSDSESVLVYYDASHVVSAIMITYSGNLKNAPTPMTVFGEDTPPKADGGIFKMVRYPKAGYWISYNRTAGDDAIVSIAIQKI